MRPLSDIQERVERSIEKALYEALVINGYIPDRDVYKNNRAAYDAQFASIASAKGFAVELFGHGSPQDRQVKSVPRIVINGRGFYPGDTGNTFEPIYINQGTHYEKVLESAMFSNYRFEITLLSNNTRQDRLLEAIRQSVLPNLGFIRMYDEPEVRFMIKYGFFKQNPDLTLGLIEKIYTYEAVDLKEQEPEVINSSVPKMTEITIKEEGQEFIKKNSLLIQVDEATSIDEPDPDTILN